MSPGAADHGFFAYRQNVAVTAGHPGSAARLGVPPMGPIFIGSSLPPDGSMHSANKVITTLRSI